MNRFFADAFYWVARFSPRDSWHARVRAFTAGLDAYHFYTTEEVLTEFLAYYSMTDPVYRLRAARWMRALLGDPRITVIPQTHEGFLDGLNLYEENADRIVDRADDADRNVGERFARPISGRVPRSSRVPSGLTGIQRRMVGGARVRVCTEAAGGSAPADISVGCRCPADEFVGKYH